MKQVLIRAYFKYGAVLLILLFAAAQFFLILRHKSPYISDSFFYKQVYYQLKGDSFEESRGKVLSEVDLNKADQITKNIFEDEGTYKYAYGFFTKRPLYPFLAYLISIISPSILFSFMLPIFAAYLGIVIMVYYFSTKELGKIFGIAATALFISFYPFLDWSTYFMTDTIGAFFWLLQLFFVYKFLETNIPKWLVFFTIALSLSLLNREQSILMIPLIILISVLFRTFRFPTRAQKSTLILLGFSIFIVSIYIIVSALLGQKNILDTITYTQNSYGLQNKTFTPRETLDYLLKSIKDDHIVFARELVRHHWWSLISVLSALGVLKTLIYKKGKSMLSILIFSSGVASYLSIFIYPVLSYRYFFPLLFAIVYFAMKFTKDYFEKK